MAPGAKKSKPVAADTPRAAVRQRLNEQQFLIENMDLLSIPAITSPGWNKKKKGQNKEFKHLTPLAISSAKIVNILNRSSGAETFLNATSQEFSALVPSIKLYMPMSDGSPNGKLKDELLYFGNYIKADGKVKYSRGDKKGITPESFLESAKGRSVGLKSFVYEQHTNHPGEKSMTASVEIFFQSISDLTSGPYVEMLVPIVDPNSPLPSLAKGASHNEKAHRINELKVKKAAVKRAMKGNKNTEVNPPASRMKAIIGWSSSIPTGQSTGRSAKRMEGIHKFLKSSQEVIILEMTKYNLTFGAEGQATLKIDYVARSDNAFAGPGYNILTAGTSYRTNIPASVLFGKDKDLVNTLDDDSYVRWAVLRQVKEWKDEGVEHQHDGFLWDSKLEQKGFLLTYEKTRLDVMLHSAVLDIAQLGNDEEAIKKAMKALENSKYVANKVASYSRSDIYGAFLEKLNQTKKIFSQTIPAAYLGIDSSEKGRETVGLRVLATKSSRVQIHGRHGATITRRISREVITAVEEGDEDKRSKLLDKAKTKGALRTVQKSNQGNVTVSYIFLGDLVDVVYGLTDNKDSKNKNVMLGNFMLPPLLAAIPSKEYNIADIPISLKSFQTFFLDRVVKPQVLTYAFQDFVKDVLKFIVEPALNEEGLLRPRDPVSQTGYTFFLSTFTSPLRFSKGESYYENSPEITSLTGLRNKPEIRDSDQYVDNLIILSREGFNGTGNYDEDLGKGIYHLVLGADRGPVKSFSFTQQENKYMHAINMAGASTGNKISVMAIPQDATITLVGTTLFKQGSLVFINAEFAMGREVATKLKIGGYYLVTKVTHELSADKYNTKLKCIWQNKYQDKSKGKTGGVKSSPSSGG